MEEVKRAESTRNPFQETPTAALVGELMGRKDLRPEHIVALQSLQAAEDNKPEIIPQTKSAEEQNQKLAEKFANAVIRRNVFGKLPRGTKINGVEINKAEVAAQDDHGPDQLHLSLLETNVSLLHSLLGQYEITLRELINSHIVSVTPSGTGKENMVLTIHFFQDKSQVDTRGYFSSAHVAVELPSAVMTEFLDEIQKNPDLLEDFYQQAFNELDNREGNPGLRRIKSDGFFLISGTEAEKVGKIKKNDTQAINTFFKSLTKHQYQHGPYGTGEAFQPSR